MTPQEPQKRTLEEMHKWWLSKFVKGLPTIVTPSSTGEPELHPDFIEALHHQLQKARQDWLREEIVRLEEEKNKVSDSGEFGAGQLDSLYFIIDRYQAGLNQPTNNQTL